MLSDRPKRRAGRPAKPLQDDGEPLTELARALRKLREFCGGPTYGQLQEITGVNHRLLATAARGEQLASWNTVTAYVRGCWEHADTQGIPVDGRGDFSAWEQRYNAAGGIPWSSSRSRSTRRRSAGRTSGASHAWSSASEPSGAAPRRHWTFPHSWIAAAITLTVLIICAGVAALVHAQAGSASRSRQAVNASSTAAGPATPSPRATLVASACGDIASASFGILAPATTTFTSTVATNPLSINGLSAVGEQGMFDGRSYAWLVGYSVDGKGGIQLAWTSGDGRWHRCNGTPDSHNPGQPFMTAAVPVTMSGVAISYQACIWRSGPPFTEQCTKIYEVAGK